MFLFGDINKGIKEYRSTPEAILVDVREAAEFDSGHIEGAVNVPLSIIRSAELPKDKPIFLYCLRGSRSRQAAGILKKMGYANVKSIGGIKGYKGLPVRD